LVSVIIPTYNRSALVREAVASVLAQEDVDFELIVVNDGSSDDTSAALASFGPAIHSISKTRGGVSSARNAGIRAASGEWLAFLDSDDLWLPQKLRKQLAFLGQNPELKICQTEEIWVRNGLRLNPKKYHRKPRGYCFTQLLERCLVSPSAVILHREVFSEVGLFNESLPACEDYDLWLRVGYRYPIGLLEEPLTVKRGGHADQLSTSVPALDRYRIQALAGLLQDESLTSGQKESAMQALHRKCRIYADGCRKRGRQEEADSLHRLLENLKQASGAEPSGTISWPTMTTRRASDRCNKPTPGLCNSWNNSIY
jgi:glycosyltransferase involved in cell wall biosynthesis